MRWRGLLLLLGIACLFVVSVQVGAQDRGQTEEAEAAKPKHTIKQVMEINHKGGGLLKKVLDGEASQEEKLVLLDHYVSLAENKPPRGEKEAWDMKVNAVLIAAAKIAVGREDSAPLLQKAANCAACHREHRPPQQ